MKRRQFLQDSAGASLAFPGLLTSNCARGKEFDLLISGGTVYDGLGNQGIGADVAVYGGRIAKIASSISKNKAFEVIDATGKAVAPGFIDPHTHTDIQLLVNPKAESKIRQGVTIEVGGNCGGSQFPISDESFEEKRKNFADHNGVELTWKDAAGFFNRLEETGMAINYATFLGHGTVRNTVMGPYDRPPTNEELGRMKQIVRDSMQQGVLGLSTGLIYNPGSFAEIDELIELCKEVARLKGVYATHMRDESDYLLEAIDEAVTIARKSGVSLQISHFKTMYPRNYAKIDKMLQAVDTATAEGIDLLADRYPYIASSTGMSSFYPQWVREGTTDEFVARLKDPSLDTKLRGFIRDWENKAGSWDNVLINGVNLGENKFLEGATVLDGSSKTGKKPYEFMRDLMISERGGVSVVKFAMDENNLRRVLSHPLVVIGSDGNAIAPYGKLGEGKPHPRSYGTFPRVLGKYVREDKVLTLPQAIRKMSAQTADKFGFTDRCRIVESCYADLVVFDPDTVIDKATFADPHKYPEGIDHVIVNGVPVIQHGEHTGNLPGKILKTKQT
ncbi:MAG: D-aminoacylase [Candidatus Latescibacteria bacterium]|nr:D-aminoacylase [Candidatus Latescibacterota bacterium]